MFRKLSSSPIPKTNQEARTLESVDVSQYETKASFNSLPDDLITHLLLPFTFLGAKEAARVLPQVSKRTDALLKDKSLYHQLEIQAAFRHLVRGEQNQVKAILKEAQQTNPDFLLSLLKTQFTITDHAQRQFNKITLFQLAVWYLDRHMWEMLLEYLPKEEAAIQLQEHESGKASYVKEYGRHYDFEGPQGLIPALEKYVQLVAMHLSLINWTQADQQWQRGVGGAQGQAPLHVIHEYCREDVAFAPLTETRFKEKTLPRTIDFYSWLTGTSVVSWAGLRSGLGTSFGLYRVSENHGKMGRAREVVGCRRGVEDFKAVSRLCDVRKEEYELLKKALIPQPGLSQEESLFLSPKPGR